ncbi:MAG: EAL domain-containing protein [Rhodocyclaceae bacterium]|nr:MAG: EAL domain-containing protein [Rhodocyclaceae bacterium]
MFNLSTKKLRHLSALSRLRPWRSLQGKLVALTVGMFVIFMWVLVFFSATILQNRLELLLSDQQYASTQRIAAEIDNKLKEQIHALTKTAEGFPEPLTPATADAFFAKLFGLNLGFTAGVDLIGLNGIVIADYPSTSGRRGQDFGDRDFFRKVVATKKAFIDRPIMGRVVVRPILTIAVPVIDHGGNIRAVLAGYTNLSAPSFLGIVSDQSMTGKGELFVISPHDNIIVAATDPKRSMATAPARGRNTLYDRFVDGFEGSGIGVSSDNIPKLYSAKRVATSNWIVMAALPTEIAFGPVRAMQNFLFGAAAILTLLAFFIIRWITRSLLTPLGEAGRAMRRITEGTAPLAPLPIVNHDEIGQLIGNFNLLIEDRQRYETALADSEQRFRQLVENAPEAIFVQTHACFAYVNMAAVRLFGASVKEQLLGQPIISRVHPDWRSIVEERIRLSSLMKKGNPPLDITYLRLDGKPLEVEVSSVPFHFENVDGSLIFLRDITERNRAKQAMQKSEERFRDLTSMSSDWFWEQDADFRFTEVSGGITKAGLDPGSMIGKTTWDISVVAVAGKDWQAHRKVLERHEPFKDLVYQIETQPGALRWFSMTGSPKFENDGSFIGYRGIGKDITDRIASEIQLRLSAEVFENSHEGIFITDRENRIVTTNSAFTELTGYPRMEVIGRDPSFLASGRHGKEFYAGIWKALLEEGYWQGEIWERRKNGEIYPKWLSISAVKDSTGAIANFIAIFVDITERKANEQQIEFLAHHDVLTKLPNRLLVKDRLQQAMAHAERSNSKLALLFLDLDNFKTINDTLGHSVGDALLKAVASRLRDCVRDTDTISRQGGDEFLIILTDLPDAEAATPIVEKLLERFQVPFEADSHDVTTSVSIGVALYPDDGDDLEALQKNADMAMYQAKDAGRNTYRFFDGQMNVEAIEHLRIRNGLLLAIERGELVLHYQPQIDLASGAVVGAEALIRWNHPEFGMVPPGRFIPNAEESGLIVPIGEWVLQEACRQAVAWRQAGLPELVVAVNLSAVQFKRGDVEQTVNNALKSTGHYPPMLELELTESILIRDTASILATVKRLKLLGVKLSIDDFGTGYSSLSYLKRFSVDKLKIDQSFIRDLGTDPDDAAIVRAIIQMARSLGLKTIAEGVEDEQMLHHLRVFHCDEAQGYHFARPMPATEFASYLLQPRARPI